MGSRWTARTDQHPRQVAVGTLGGWDAGDQEVAPCRAVRAPGASDDEHIKDPDEDRGVSGKEAEERATHTVDKQRAEHGETERSS